MKKNLLFIPLCAATLIGGVMSCSPSDDGKFTLSYGTYTTNETMKISYSDLQSKMDDKESMIVATYESDDTTCACWRSFKFALDELMKQHHYLFYRVEYSEFGSKDTLGLTVNKTKPAINFIKNGVVSDSIMYSTSNPNNIFKSSEALYECINSVCNKPNYYYLDGIKGENEYHLGNIPSEYKDNYLVGYYYSSCPDCSYAFPHALLPYASKKTFKAPMFLIDCDVEGIRLLNGKPNPDPTNYQNFKDKHFLSKKNNQTFGYETGYVPTFQAYQNGQLVSASVIFNDKFIEKDGKYIINQSFYSQARRNSLTYLDNLNQDVLTILEGYEIPSEDIEVLHFKDKNGNEQVYKRWYHDKALEKHLPLIEAFLDTYAL